MANLLTILRMVLAPAVMLALLRRGPHSRLAAALFLAGGLTDGLDGAFARASRTTSPLGRDLDPLADKHLVDGALVALATRGRVSWLLAGLLLLRDCAITLLRQRDSAALTPTRAARLKTALLYAGVFGLIAGPERPRLHSIAHALITAAVGLCLLSAGEYLWRLRGAS